MEKSMKLTRFLLVCLIAACLALFLASALASGIEMGHECTGENCLICMAISLREKALHTLFLLIAVSGIVLVLAENVAISRDEQTFLVPVTPVCLKVKLSN